MQQEVNLYRHYIEAQSEKSFLSWRRFWSANYAFLMFLLFSYIYAIWSTYSLQKTNRTMAEEVKTLSVKFIKAKKAYPEIFFGNNVAKSVDELKRDFISNEQVFETIINQTPFSAILTALSQYAVQSVWLTEINIGKEGHEVTLVGHSLQMNALQKYIDTLQEAKIFNHFDLENQNVTTEPTIDKTNQLTFRITLAKQQ